MSPHHEPPLTRLAWIGMAGLALVLVAMSPVAGQVAANVAVPEPDGYRMENYRAPTPASLRGAQVVDTAQAHRLWNDKAAVFVDVMPRDVKPPNLPAGTIWRDKKREDVPGSVWLPNVGYGVLNAEMDSYFRRGLAGITEGRKDAPLVFYCKTDCWMSWNAAKRAMEYGYANITWYPGGSDGWAEAGLPLEVAKPVE
ncbi:PQQ-dependent catabolism-associated CXXCW motif protein [Ancylobacter pratisalsi]|uniref:PQQ-dependent catabolism-associated CXXCW motif protein n=1 Tax=Ancylobacter pratisalsi TaxID=1745854 RepID=A0A6P1YPM3_9HYPH|nr:PQQ-dependent catabolism-associated CXXCW motif protein [Ancylobacter pratisalsi]QIB35329.1 PQQ-dependent catabolism-associated CXXCW motif protein [Ancylobacter pratisalsi]